MSLSATRVSEPENVLLAVQKIPFHETCQLAIDRAWKTGPIKAVQGFGSGQFRLLQPSLDAPLATINQFQFAELVKVTRKR
jgi:hypothetical protein